jgi:hypothetical protein
MMAVAVATRDYFASYDQSRPVISLAHLPASIVQFKRPKNIRYLAYFGSDAAF